MARNHPSHTPHLIPSSRHCPTAHAHFRPAAAGKSRCLELLLRCCSVSGPIQRRAAQPNWLMLPFCRLLLVLAAREGGPLHCRHRYVAVLLRVHSRIPVRPRNILSLMPHHTSSSPPPPPPPLSSCRIDSCTSGGAAPSKTNLLSHATAAASSWTL